MDVLRLAQVRIFYNSDKTEAFCDASTEAPQDGLLLLGCADMSELRSAIVDHLEKGRLEIVSATDKCSRRIVAATSSAEPNANQGLPARPCKGVVTVL